MAARPEELSLAQFVAWEAAQAEKHEYVRGRVVAFAGGTLAHAAIAAALIAQSYPLAARRGCAVFGSDAMILTSATGRYPDVVLTCDPRDLADPTRVGVRFPKLIIEVLSESTVATDRGEKLDEYRSIETLEEYVLIDSRRRWAERFHRTGNDWIVSLPITAGLLHLASLDHAIDLDALYDGASVPATAPQTT